MENQKRGLLGKGLVPFGEDSWGWETHEWRVFCEQHGRVLWNQKRRSL